MLRCCNLNGNGPGVRGIVEHVQSGDPAKLFMIYNVTGGVLGVLHSVPNLPGVPVSVPVVPGVPESVSIGRTVLPGVPVSVPGVPGMPVSASEPTKSVPGVPHAATTAFVVVSDVPGATGVAASMPGDHAITHGLGDLVPIVFKHVPQEGRVELLFLFFPIETHQA